VQCEIGVNVEPAHAATPQLTHELAISHAPMPLQLPVLPQGGLAAHSACGSTSPGLTLAQVPALPTMLQAMHVPHIEAVQQTPSTQKLPVRQSVVCAQVWPRRFLLPHRLVLGSQIAGARQSVSAVHAALQADVPLHRNGAHGIVAGDWQLPTPSQVRACVSVDWPTAHEGATHCVPAA
jgi:hypothetical protein